MARHCIEAGELKSLKLLLEHGCSKRVLIHSAIMHNQKECLIELLSSGADPNEIAANNATPLSTALKTNNLDLAQILLDNGADPNLIVNNVRFYLSIFYYTKQ